MDSLSSGPRPRTARVAALPHRCGVHRLRGCGGRRPGQPEQHRSEESGMTTKLSKIERSTYRLVATAISEARRKLEKQSKLGVGHAEAPRSLRSGRRLLEGNRDSL